jgi:hypothetical protein
MGFCIVFCRGFYHKPPSPCEPGRLAPGDPAKGPFLGSRNSAKKGPSRESSDETARTPACCVVSY